jgi:hypothetical protein
VSRHRFAPGFVESRWTLLPRRSRGSYSVRLTFPSWGKHASITAVLHDGRRVDVGRVQPAIAEVAWFHIAGADRGYVIVVRSRRLPGRVRTIRPRQQASAPHPGRTLVLDLLGHRRLRRLSATVRYAPAKDAADAERVAQLLRG